ncbi:hypothetical protein HDV06_000296 [Boothiomyces sp. JEL0866]|nr:hypothetical protein HDV06_000296 [Boothiomyces sp. JEL0866]
MYILQFIFLNPVFSTLALSSSWSNEDCQGSPKAIYAFEISSTTANSPPIGDTWPHSYIFQAHEKTIADQCTGRALKVPVKGCCVNSLDLSKSFGVQSAATVVADNGVMIATPAAANNHTYCTLQGNVFGFSSIMYLADNNCNQIDNIICTEHGVLKVFPEALCSGNPQIFQLQNTGQLISSNTFANVTATFLSVSGGQFSIDWVAVFPFADLTPDFKCWIDILSAIFTGGSILMIAIALIPLTKEFINSMSPFLMTMIVSEILFLVTTVLMCVEFYIKDPPANLHYAVNFFISVATLVAVLGATLILVQFHDFTSKGRVLMLAFMILINMVFCLNKYLFFIKSPALNLMFNLWLIFFGLYDIIPSIYAFYSFTHDPEKPKTMVQRLLDLDSVFLFSMGMHIANFVSFFALVYITVFTSWLGSDKNWKSIAGFFTVILATHGFLNVILLLRIQIISKRARDKIAELQEKYGSLSPLYV